MQMQNKKHRHVDAKTLFVRIVALVVCALLLAGTVLVAVLS
jgi:hypothetical protein